MITQAYGALELAFTPQFKLLWNDKGSGADGDAAFWLPVAQGDWRPIGAIAVKNYDDISGKQGGLLVQATDGHADALKFPVDYELIWADHGSGAKRDGAVWRPKPPEGYAALGDLFWPGYDRPPLDAVWCARRDIVGRQYVTPGEVGDRLWWDKKSGAKTDVSVWSIDTPRYPENQEEMLLLPAKTFTAVPNYDQPSTTAVVNVLNLPSAVTVLPGPPVPAMTSYDQPPRTIRVINRQDVVPYTLVLDPGKSEAWRVENSPFYTLQREQWYQQVMFRDNRNGSSPATMTDQVETGVSREKSNSFSVKTGISVSVEGGIDLIVDAKYNVNVSLELGYEYRYSDTVFRNETKTQELIVPPHSSGTLWAEVDRIFPIRLDGSMLGQDAELTFTTDAYVTGEYPAGTGVRSSTDSQIPAARREAAQTEHAKLAPS